MTHSLCVVIVAGAFCAQVEGPCPCNAPTRTAGPFIQSTTTNHGGLVGWLRNMLNPRATVSHDSQPSAPPAGSAPVQQVVYIGTAAPNQGVPATRRTFLPVTQSPTQTMVVANPQAIAPPVAKKYEDRVGHERDYSWVTGHLFFIHADGGRWVVRYGLPDEVDRFGGSVVLAPGLEMRNYREGDLVCVYGDVLDEGRTSRSLGGALYRVNVISLVDRADP